MAEGREQGTIEDGVTEPPQDPGAPIEHGGNYLEVLHADYAALRSDQQGLNTLITGLFSLGVVIFGPIGYFLVAQCHPATLSCDGSVWPPVMALVPLGPLGIIGFFGVLSNVNIVRSYYIRAVEHELQRVSGSPEISFRGGEPIRLPSFVEITETMVSQRRGLIHYRLLNLLSVLTLGLLFIGTTILCLLYARPVDLQVAGAMFYLGVIVLLGLTVWDATKGGPGLWRYATRHVHRVNEADAVDARTTRQGRRFISYLLLPRPGDLLYKGWIIPIAWLLATAGTAQIGWSAWWSLIAITAVFELVFYQGRYIVNDLRGLGVDAAYSVFKRNTRFPESAGRREILAAILVVALRLVVAVWFALRVLPWRSAQVLLLAMAAVVVQAVIYEALREVVSGRPGANLLALTPARASLLFIVGTGYAIRACVGIGLGQLGNQPWVTLALVAAMMTALGSMFVTMTWALDGVIQVVPHPGEDLPSHRYRASLEGACHIAPLLGQACLLRDRGQGLERTSAHSPARENSSPLNRRRSLERISGPTWWNAMALLAAPLATIAGARLAGDARISSLVLAALIGLATGAGLVGAYGGDSRRWLGLREPADPSWARGMLVLLAGTALVAGLSAGATARAVYVSWITLALVGLVYLFFRQATRAAILFDPAVVMAALGDAARSMLGRWALVLLGPEAARRLGALPRSTRRQPRRTPAGPRAAGSSLSRPGAGGKEVNGSALSGPLVATGAESAVPADEGAGSNAG